MVWACIAMFLLGFIVGFFGVAFVYGISSEKRDDVKIETLTIGNAEKGECCKDERG